MQAGLLTDIVSFHEREEVRGKLGGLSDTWVFKFETRADVRFKSGGRKNSNGEIINVKTHTVTTRMNKSIVEKMRIYHDGKKYNILSIDHNRKQQATIIEIELINE